MKSKKKANNNRMYQEEELINCQSQNTKTENYEKEIDLSKVKAYLENKNNMKIDKFSKPEDTLEFMEHML